jgi:hypothetical protein
MSLAAHVVRVYRLSAFSVIVLAGSLAYSFSPKEEARKTMSAITEMNSFRQALLEFHKTCKRYPTTLEGIDILFAKPKVKNCAYEPPPYLANGKSLDPWGNKYIYSADENSFRLNSMGSSWIESTDQAETKYIDRGR